NGAAITGTANLTGGYSFLALEQSGMIAGVTVNLDNTNFVNAARIVEGYNAVTFASNVLVRGLGAVGRQILAAGSNSIVNQGTIRADVAGRTLTIAGGDVGGSFANAGTADARDGATLSITVPNIINSGTLRATY